VPEAVAKTGFESTTKQSSNVAASPETFVILKS
jgi:hypothetical protein